MEENVKEEVRHNLIGFEHSEENENVHQYIDRRYK